MTSVTTGKGSLTVPELIGIRRIVSWMEIP